MGQRLNDVLPKLALNNLGYCDLIHSVFSRQRSVIKLQGANPNLLNKLFRKYGPSVSFSRAIWLSAFIFCVCVILGLGAKEKMTRVNAKRNVACVAHAHPFRNVSDAQSIRNDMCQPVSIMGRRTICDLPILSVFRSFPQPTIGGASNANSTPESWYNFSRKITSFESFRVHVNEILRIGYLVNHEYA